MSKHLKEYTLFLISIIKQIAYRQLIYLLFRVLNITWIVIWKMKLCWTLLAKRLKNALFVVSHCDGAFVLAKSGILTGHESTTFPGDIAVYKKMFPQLRVHENVFFVHDGKFITSAGGAKSFEASLYLCEIMYGKNVANQIAKGMVIEWDLQKTSHIVVQNKD